MSRADRRSWLHPRWYVARFEGIVLGGVRPHKFVPADEPEPICTNCGQSCPDGGFNVGDHQDWRSEWPTWAKGYWCLACGDALPKRKLNPLVELLEVVDVRLDRIYWWYCARYGKVVVQAR